MVKKITVTCIVIAVIVVSIAIAITTTSADVVLKTFEKGQLLKETNFDSGSGLPWHVCVSSPAEAEFELKNGKYYVTLTEQGENPWDVQFRHRDLAIQSGHKYDLEFTVEASNNCEIYPKIGDQNEPYKEDWNPEMQWKTIDLSAGTPKTVKASFTADRTAEVLEFAFHLAGKNKKTPVGTEFCFDDISLTDPQFAGYEDETRPDFREIRVNQLGYFPNRQKLATLRADESSPVAWSLEDSSGTEVANGETTVFGDDNDSGEHVHIIDFSDYTTPGKNYKLKAKSSPVSGEGLSTSSSSKTSSSSNSSSRSSSRSSSSNSGFSSDWFSRFSSRPGAYSKPGAGSSPALVESYPFDIADTLYNDLIYDSLKYFYHSRSGIEIKMPYCEEEQWARPAGHTNDVMPTSQQEKGDWVYNENFTVDVTGGWYDAGDHGKYVVNGGITVWTLQNMYERGLHNDDGVDAFADDTMNIPESGNSIPDVLDETRYHLDVMLKMQVPEGKDRAGMAFHKGHDETWTGLAVRPDQDELDRILKPPTTAATLNLAATAAQASRIWKEYDSSFADECITAAEKAWDAALKNPDIYAPFDEAIGGGPYGDDYVMDDFYWAACELYAATGGEQYLEFIHESDHCFEVPDYLTKGEEKKTVGQFNWGNTAALGTLTLALGASDLSEEDLQKCRDSVAKAGDFTLGIQDKQGYGITIAPCPVLDEGFEGYPWGSNSFVTNSCLVLAYAYDYTQDTKYLDGMTEAMDYIMGRNPNELSYITGYGDYPVKNPHHRFFSHQVDSSFPTAPPGICVGGPNSGLQDPWVKGSGWNPGDRAPQKCYMDHIESWSTNECTINWNAPIGWIASYLEANGND
jgi:endoglucanase